MTDAQHETDDQETYPNPLAGAFGAPPAELGPDAQVVEPSDPDGTAKIIAGTANWVCTLKWDTPLTEEEAAELRHDVAAVLRKYDVPNLPYQEEASLAMTTGGIVFRRAIAAKKGAQQAPRDAAEPPKPQGVHPHVDYARSREEGERKIRYPAQDMFSGVTPESRAVLP